MERSLINQLNQSAKLYGGGKNNVTEMKTGLPSVRQLQTFIRNGQQVEVKISTGDMLTGKLLWQDDECICIADANNQPLIIWRHALVLIKPLV
ncbi:MAG: RNA-binding protein hfq [Leptolyngbyaceae bacterium]|nr:RNA-binding protein hfq [Leptolyngbyaceae bacterium]